VIDFLKRNWLVVAAVAVVVFLATRRKTATPGSQMPGTGAVHPNERGEVDLGYTPPTMGWGDVAKFSDAARAAGVPIQDASKIAPAGQEFPGWYRDDQGGWYSPDTGEYLAPGTSPPAGRSGYDAGTGLPRPEPDLSHVVENPDPMREGYVVY
jgi:hypothetical protein